MTPAEALHSQNVQAFLRAIRLGEGTRDDDGYRRIVGGELFDDFSDHPRKRVWIERYKVWSTAAGAYQFISTTWDEMRDKYDLPDFSPASQDLAAVGLLIRRKALDDVIAGRVEAAIEKCRLEWASLPGSPYGQRTESMTRVLAEYAAHGGGFELETAVPVETPTAIVLEQDPAPIVESKPVLVREEKPMSPFIAAALPALIEQIPGLIRVFGDGRVTERNAEAATRVVEIVKAATNAQNEQAAVDAVSTDMQARVTAAEALKREGWMEPTEAGGEGIAGARDFNLKAAEVSPLKMPAMWVTLMLLPLAYMVVGAVLFSDGYSPEMQALVVGAIMSGVLAAVTAFWLGTVMRNNSNQQG